MERSGLVRVALMAQQQPLLQEGESLWSPCCVCSEWRGTEWGCVLPRAFSSFFSFLIVKYNWGIFTDGR